jgi:hypothetical protein
MEEPSAIPVSSASTVMDDLSKFSSEVLGLSLKKSQLLLLTTFCLTRHEELRTIMLDQSNRIGLLDSQKSLRSMTTSSTRNKP